MNLYKLIICKGCRQRKPHKARGLCRNCYNKQGRPEVICKSCGQRKSHHAYGLCVSCSGKKYNKKNPHKHWIRHTLHNHRKKYKVNITIDELTKLAKETKKCIYCSRKLIFQYGKRGGKAEKDSPSLDRIDNENELNINNVQIICFECNDMKGRKTHEGLIKWCKYIVERFGSK